MSTIYDVDVLHSSSGKYAITALGVYGDVLFVGCDDGCLRLLDNRLRTADVYLPAHNRAALAHRELPLRGMVSRWARDKRSIRQLLVVPQWGVLLSLADAALSIHPLGELAHPLVCLTSLKDTIGVSVNPQLGLLAVATRTAVHVYSWSHHVAAWDVVHDVEVGKQREMKLSAAPDSSGASLMLPVTEYRVEPWHASTREAETRRRHTSLVAPLASMSASVSASGANSACIVSLSWLGSLLCASVVHRADVSLQPPLDSHITHLCAEPAAALEGGAAGSTPYVLSYVMVHPLTGKVVKECQAGLAPSLDAACALHLSYTVDQSSASSASTAGSAGGAPASNAPGASVDASGGVVHNIAPGSGGGGGGGGGWGMACLLRGATEDFSTRTDARTQRSAAASGASEVAHHTASPASIPIPSGPLFSLVVAQERSTSVTTVGTASGLPSSVPCLSISAVSMHEMHDDVMQTLSIPPVQLPSQPVSMFGSPNFPYICSLHSDRLCVYNSTAGSLQQVKSIPSAIDMQMCPIQFAVHMAIACNKSIDIPHTLHDQVIKTMQLGELLYVASRDAVYSMRMVPILLQVAALTSSWSAPLFEPAIELCERFETMKRRLYLFHKAVEPSLAWESFHSGSFLELEGADHRAKIRSTQAQYGYHLFAREQFGRSFTALQAAREPTLRILSLVPQLLPASVPACKDYPVHVPVMIETTLCQAIPHLVQYLWLQRRQLGCDTASPSELLCDVDADGEQLSVTWSVVANGPAYDAFSFDAPNVHLDVPRWTAAMLVDTVLLIALLWQCAYLRGLSVDAHARALDQPNAGSPASLAAQLEQAERDLHDLLYTPNCVNAEEAEVQLSAFGRGQSNDMLQLYSSKGLSEKVMTLLQHRVLAPTASLESSEADLLALLTHVRTLPSTYADMVEQVALPFLAGDHDLPGLCAGVWALAPRLDGSGYPLHRALRMFDDVACRLQQRLAWWITCPPFMPTTFTSLADAAAHFIPPQAFDEDEDDAVTSGLRDAPVTPAVWNALLRAALLQYALMPYDSAGAVLYGSQPPSAPLLVADAAVPLSSVAVGAGAAALWEEFVRALLRCIHVLATSDAEAMHKAFSLRGIKTAAAACALRGSVRLVEEGGSDAREGGAGGGAPSCVNLITHFRRRLLAALRRAPPTLPAARLLAELPPGAFPNEHAELLRRLGRHTAALRILIHDASDFVAAEQYCKTVTAALAASSPASATAHTSSEWGAARTLGMASPPASVPALLSPPSSGAAAQPLAAQLSSSRMEAGAVYTALLQALFSESETHASGVRANRARIVEAGSAPSSARAPPPPASAAAAAYSGSMDAKLDAVLPLLQANLSSLDFSHILKTLPDSVPIARIAPVLSCILRAEENVAHAARVTRALEASTNVNALVRLHRGEADYVRVDHTTKCDVCHKRLCVSSRSVGDIAVNVARHRAVHKACAVEGERHVAVAAEEAAHA